MTFDFSNDVLISKMGLLISQMTFDFQNRIFDFSNEILISKMSHVKCHTPKKSKRQNFEIKRLNFVVKSIRREMLTYTREMAIQTPQIRFKFSSFLVRLKTLLSYFQSLHHGYYFEAFKSTTLAHAFVRRPCVPVSFELLKVDLISSIVHVTDEGLRQKRFYFLLNFLTF